MEARQAWAEYWSAPTGAGGCLPGGADAIGSAQRGVWRAFAALLPPGARVLDLATGDGRVLRMLHAAHPDLHLQGCDAAPALPPAPSGIRLQGGVRMEALPFGDGQFEALTAQFGYEYGNTARVAGEAARVLKPGGRAGLMLHRGDSPILSQNRSRRTQLRWAVEERDLLRRAQAYAVVAASGAPVPAELHNAPREAAKTFGPRSLAWEVAEALRRAALARDVAGVAAIGRKASGEIARIDDLERACAVADDLDTLRAQWAANGLVLEQVEDVTIASSEPPFAQFVRLLRSD